MDHQEDEEATLPGSFHFDIVRCAGCDGSAEPITAGVPLPQGAVREGQRVRLSQNGQTSPVQQRVLDRWPDGSARWMLLDCLATGDAIDVHMPSDQPSIEVPCSLDIQEVDEGLDIRTGPAEFVLRPGTSVPFSEVRVDGRNILSADGSAIELKDDKGQARMAEADRIRVLEKGPVRLGVLVEGAIGDPDDPDELRFQCELHFFAGRADVRCRLTVHNPRAAGHPGGLWDLGAKGAALFQELSVRLPLRVEDQAKCEVSAEPGEPFRQTSRSAEIYQDSSGGENWQSTCHVNREGRVPVRFRGYRWSAGEEQGEGLRARPLMRVQRGEETLVAVGMEHFWQNFPKSITWQPGLLELGLFPGQFGDLHELQGGERKTHEFALSFDRHADCSSLEWLRCPAAVRIDPEWVCQTQAIRHLLPRTKDPNTKYLALVDAAIKGDDTFFDKRERVDEYGWRHFGDVYADHEAIYHEGPGELVSHYNNQYDVVWGLGVQFLRSGDLRWRELMRDLASHVYDIDVYHTDRDKWAYNHGMFWHTYHYVDAGRSTHRTYSADVDVCGGGPSGGHLYTSGLMLHYFLTGDRLARETVLELANYAIDADDGSRTPLRWLSRRPTGHTTCSTSGYYGPGRAPANSINALVDAHRLSGGRGFLEQAEAYIYRCIHPQDDQDQLNLLDAETRWFYTMFLQNLGKYIEHKAEFGETDKMYTFAAAAMLSYADWMVENEYPYLDRPEKLEYPNETWAAQDMRKCEVFQYAGRLASGATQERFYERAAFFFRTSVDTLARWKTRTLTRPVVLMLAFGWSRAAYTSASPPSPLVPLPSIAEFGEPIEFRPQKEVAIRNMKVIALLGGVASLAGVAVALSLLLN